MTSGEDKSVYIANFLKFVIIDEPALDVTPILQKKLTVEQMFKTAEDFFLSIGWPKLPHLFWKRSLFKEPKDRNVTCHASAWDFSVVRNGSEDVR